jgi:hypothetical protein
MWYRVLMLGLFFALQSPREFGKEFVIHLINKNNKERRQCLSSCKEAPHIKANS